MKQLQPCAATRRFDQVRITTGARLHFGFLAFGDPAARQFGGVGAMVDQPGIVLSAQASRQDEFEGDPQYLPVLLTLVEKFRATGPPLANPRRVRLALEAAMPRHAGFGSGTQLALAVGTALAHLEGGTHEMITALAARLGRGARSALGIHGFSRGGLLLEAGKQAASPIGPLVSCCALPEAWRFVLITPASGQGLEGALERHAFEQLPAMPADVSGRLCRLAVTEIFPAAIEQDFAAFARSLHQFGTLVGECFSAVQGGVYHDPTMARLARRLLSQGHQGVAQTSWGPTITVACPDHATAASLVNDLQSLPESHDWQLRVARPLNHGASTVAG